MHKISFHRLFPNANPDALDLLDKLLAFDPSSRITVEEALEHRYLHIWHDASDEPACPTTFDFTFEVVDDVQDMRKMILDEVMRFRRVVRNQGAPSLQVQLPTAQAQTEQLQQQAAAQQQNVPMPGDQAYTYRQDDPRPQEAYQGNLDDLEATLARGLDATR